NMGHDNMMGSFDGCGGEELQGEWKDYITDVTTLTLSNGENITIYTIKINGKTIYVAQGGNDKPVAFSLVTDTTTQAIVVGLNAGFDDMQNRGVDWSNINVKVLLNDIANFTDFYLSSWEQIYSGKDILFTFIKHATVGGGIKQAIAYDQREGDQSPSGNGDHGQYNMIFGFWTSYSVAEYEKETKKIIKWNSSKTYNPKTGETYTDPEKDALGIVDIARVGRSIMYSEKRSYCFDPTWGPSASGDWGLMQLNDYWFPDNVNKSLLFKNLRNMSNVNWRTNAFFNIGGGMLELLDWLYHYGDNSINGWTLIAGAYNTGSYGPGSDPDVESNRIEYMETFKKHLFKNFGK
ncbi:hypothetical protein LLG10_03085, partial [bacterium]|nr:hypothetical protein [bacterium]